MKKKIKISSLWNATVNLNISVIINLLKILSNRDIEFVKVNDCDILIFGPYENQSLVSIFKRRLVNKLFKKNIHLRKNFPNLDIFKLNRKFNPLRIFLSFENYNFPNVEYDFAISSFLGIDEDNHLRFPQWKELIDWSKDGINRKPDSFLRRFGKFYDPERLILPQGDFFMKKNRKACIITSHLSEPRKSIVKKFSKFIQVDGYGAYYDRKIKDHFSSPLNKLEILKNYAFNLCPENSLYPGYYTEKIPEAFLGKTLPITWVDQNVKQDFNPKSFINLLDHTNDNYFNVIQLLNDDLFLKKFTNEPLMLKKPNLDNEIKFVKKILDAL